MGNDFLQTNPPSWVFPQEASNQVAAICEETLNFTPAIFLLSCEIRLRYTVRLKKTGTGNSHIL